MGPRPSNHEICKKVADALVILKAGARMMVVSRHYYSDLADLELDSPEEFQDLLVVLLGEIQRLGPTECYAGGRPPQRSYDKELANVELWAFCWHSERLKKKMYLKFALQKDCYIHVDCHESSPKN